MIETKTAMRSILAPIFAGTVIPVRVSTDALPTPPGTLSLVLDPSRLKQTPATMDAIANLDGARLECKMLEVRDSARAILVEITRLARGDQGVPFQCNHQDVAEGLGVAPMVSPRWNRLFPGYSHKGWGFLAVEEPGLFDPNTPLSPEDKLVFILGASIFLQSR